MIPCELVAIKLLPIIRRQLVIEMLKEGKKQREIASALNLNESAISHYVAKRRAAKDTSLDKMVHDEVIACCKKSDNFAAKVCEICKNLRMSHKLCIIHKRNSSTTKMISPEDCKICLSKCV